MKMAALFAIGVAGCADRPSDHASSVSGDADRPDVTDAPGTTDSASERMPEVIGCREESRAFDEARAPVSKVYAAALLDRDLTAAISWSRTLTADRSRLSVGVTAALEDARLVNHLRGAGSGCPAGMATRVPVILDVNIDDGGATCSLRGAIDLFDESATTPLLADIQGPCALSREWGTPATASMSDVSSPGWRGFLVGHPGSVSISIQGEGHETDGSGVVRALWGGTTDLAW